MFNLKPILKVEKAAGLTTNNFYRQQISSFSLPPVNASFTFNMPSYHRIVKVNLASWDSCKIMKFLWLAFAVATSKHMTFLPMQEAHPLSRGIIVASP
jgi:hypothetical protein